MSMMLLVVNKPTEINKLPLEVGTYISVLGNNIFIAKDDKWIHIDDNHTEVWDGCMNNSLRVILTLR